MQVIPEGASLGHIPFGPHGIAVLVTSKRRCADVYLLGSSFSFVPPDKVLSQHSLGKTKEPSLHGLSRHSGAAWA